MRNWIECGILRIPRTSTTNSTTTANSYREQLPRKLLRKLPRKLPRILLLRIATVNTANTSTTNTSTKSTQIYHDHCHQIYLHHFSHNYHKTYHINPLQPFPSQPQCTPQLLGVPHRPSCDTRPQYEWPASAVQRTLRRKRNCTRSSISFGSTQTTSRTHLRPSRTYVASRSHTAATPVVSSFANRGVAWDYKHYRIDRHCSGRYEMRWSAFVHTACDRARSAVSGCEGARPCQLLSACQPQRHGLLQNRLESSV